MQRCNAAAISVGALFFFTTAARSQPNWSEPNAVHSISGQFTITAGGGYSLLRHSQTVAGNSRLVRLEPSLLAVSAERFKIDLWHELGFNPSARWGGKIFLALQPARSMDDGVTIASGADLHAWNYRVELPDVLPQTRYARSLAAVLLLEIANRAATVHSAEIPAWLVDGLAQQILALDADKVALSTPARNSEGLPQSRVVKNERALDALVGVRQVLKNSPALTFEQLCWPTDAQVDGTDGGVYQSSAQLFVYELLDLKDGRACARNFLSRLPQGLNWQTAFFAAFQKYFRNPLDVEKWWALRVLNFAARDPGPRWSLAASRERLDQLLSVPVQFRADSNALPSHADIPLSAALCNFNEAQLAAVLPVKLRDLELAQFRLAPPFATLAGSYRNVLADFLGGRNPAPAAAAPRKTAPATHRRAGLEETLKQLDALDARRREVEFQLKPAVPPAALKLNTP